MIGFTACGRVHRGADRGGRTDAPGKRDGQMVSWRPMGSVGGNTNEGTNRSRARSGILGQSRRGCAVWTTACSPSTTATTGVAVSRQGRERRAGSVRFWYQPATGAWAIFRIRPAVMYANARGNRGADRRSSDQFEEGSRMDRGDAGVDVEPCHEGRDVLRGGSRADGELAGDLAVGESRREEAQHLDLARSQSVG
jgi:hypothetical protein